MDHPADSGTGAPFKHDRKTKPSQPDYRGEEDVKTGTKYMSLAFRMEEPEATKSATATVDDEIAF